MNRRAMEQETIDAAPAAGAPAGTVRLTMAQALVRYLAAQHVLAEDGSGRTEPLVGGVFAIFGHGNVAGLGEALYHARDVLPTYRAHNEQAMAHSAIAYAKAHFRRRMMAVTSSIGPGATNLVIAAALAHVNRLPVLLLPGDTFVSRAPDPVLQQIEDFHDGGISANDAFKSVSRYFDRIVHPAQLLNALPRALRMLTDAALCGPVTLALPQDVQTMAYDYPLAFFTPRVVSFHAPAPVEAELAVALGALRHAKRPFLVAGGGTLYSEGGTDALRVFAEAHGIPVGETQAGKSALPWDHPLNAGALGVTGSPAANALASEADVVIAVGTRLQDFTTGSNTLFAQANVIGINANAFDALDARLAGWRAEAAWSARAQALAAQWRDTVHTLTNTPQQAGTLPYDADVIGAVCAAGTLPAELHKLWRASVPGGYHVEYGYSCMGYEIAGGLGAKLARPEREVIVFVGDGSYLMMNSEIATSVMLGAKLIIVVLDNRGYGCINRLQQTCGGAPFNNMIEDCLQGPDGAPAIDFAAHARALGARAEHVADVAGLDAALARACRRSHLCDLDRYRRDAHHRRRRLVVGSGGTRSVAACRRARRARCLRRARRRTRRRARTPTTGIPAMSAYDIRIGVNPLSWMNDDLPSLGGETPLPLALREGKQIGYAGFELGNKFPREPQALKALLADYDLSLVSGWYSGRLAERSAQEEIDAVGPHLELLAKNGATAMVYGEVANSIQGAMDVPLYQRPRFVTEAQWERYARELDTFARYTLSHGVRVAYHHHMGAYVESPADVDKLMSLTSDALGLLFDTGHMTFGGGDPLTELRKHIGRVCHVHCKDVRPEVIRLARNRNWSFLQAVINGAFTVPGDGAVDFPAVIELLKQHGYRGWFVVEAEQDPVIAPSYAYAELGYRTLRALVDAPLPPAHQEAA
ncbi:MAG: 3D-(3,5/4)-trihydroxycyclohexane-1,2-dione hydrolase [Burkholderia plantarii]|nr:MAG: 3D-(3,5/4)-trihydroxycyclohexane-1,2-dione hydrolase [Burkholderia plantarii]